MEIILLIIVLFFVIGGIRALWLDFIRKSELKSTPYVYRTFPNLDTDSEDTILKFISSEPYGTVIEQWWDSLTDDDKSKLSERVKNLTDVKIRRTRKLSERYEAEQKLAMQ